MSAELTPVVRLLGMNVEPAHVMGFSGGSATAQKAVAEGIRGAELVAFEGEAHQPFREHPDAFNALVDALWSRAR